ncbi:MAG TPA: carboxymuconolactone decarboxylase family protein [Myxococcota bacterium]|nr:carboxymuconolactone decarboxylase family protein [Myxococcota bacterium]
MARLPYIDLAKASEPVREVFAQLPVQLNVFKLMALAETCFRPLLRLGTAILARQKLNAKLRELAILRVAALSGARYEWIQHVPIAHHVGATDDQVAALERGSIDAPCFDATERAVLRLTGELVEGVRARDATYDEVAQRLSPQEIVELILAVGYYRMLATLMETAAIDLDPPAGTKVVGALR